jgi:hypothetical protein
MFVIDYGDRDRFEFKNFCQIFQTFDATRCIDKRLSSVNKLENAKEKA